MACRLVGFVIAIVVAASLGVAEGQPPATARIGWLTTGPHPFIRDFRAGLSELGYVEGRNILIDERYAATAVERLPTLANEFARLKVDVMVASGTMATTAARNATASIPIVSVSGDPVGDGNVASLARPGRNVKGLAILSVDLAPKWTEVLKELVPRASVVAVLVDRTSGGRQWDPVESAARSLGLRAFRLDARGAPEIERAFATAAKERASGMIVTASAFFASEKRRIVDLAARYAIPAVYEHRDFVEAGGLVSYGPDFRVVFRRAAVYVDRILKGAKPADLPIEQPTKFELVINQKTAEALSLTLPPPLLLRADEVIR